MSKSTVSKITLNAYNDRYGDNPVAPLYVLNSTKPKGNVAFNCVNDVGQPVGVMVPSTFIPVDLTEQITRDSLLKSTNFRRALSKGQLVILTNESAEDYLRTNSVAKREFARINKIVGSDLEPQSDDEEVEISIDGTEIRKVRFEGAEDGESVFVSAFIDRCADEEYSDDQLEAEFLSRGIDLPKPDLQTLAEQITRPAIRELIIQAME